LKSEMYMRVTLVSSAWWSVIVKEMKLSKSKHLREVEISIMPIGNINIHKQFNVSEFINKLSFICFVNLIV